MTIFWMKLQVSVVHWDHVSAEEEVVLYLPLPFSWTSPTTILHVQGHIQENLEDELVQEALRKVCFISQVPRCLR